MLFYLLMENKIFLLSANPLFLLLPCALLTPRGAPLPVLCRPAATPAEENAGHGLSRRPNPLNAKKEKPLSPCRKERLFSVCLIQPRLRRSTTPTVLKRMRISSASDQWSM